MPLVRIEAPETLSAARAQRAGDAVHQALVDTFGVPPDDRFQVITRHPPGALVCTPEYLGVKHTAQALFVQVYCAPGRTLQQKRAFYARTAADVSAACDVSPSDVIINLVETLRENWSFGDGIAHYTL
ncbi:tautomerase family protein [Ramlibacter sp. G-1-2-2]|uniref:Tautomerase family protein n=1 Tax=Ramlibacter agri TaxID=2728837 RepID=A0A848HGV7_9BURK|nr:tautomerase family protein [Ramlibacter agri]NML48561.1 tautomerase family protein [Ramlibacter agri]